MRLIFLFLLTISFPSKNIGEETFNHTVSFETPRYVKMTDTVFQVGDLIQHNAVFRYRLGPSYMMTKEEKAGIPASDTTQFSYFLELVDFIKSHTELSFEIGCHTDYRGNAATNIHLTQTRANLIVRVMIEEYSIDYEQIRAKGYGREKPSVVYFCDGQYFRYMDDPVSWTCEEEPIPLLLTNEYIQKFKDNRVLHEHLHQLNRRTEVKVIEVQD